MIDVVQLRQEGLYCPKGDFYIDPWQPVATAVITHGHGDHARRGMGRYHTTAQGLPILQWRLGEQDYVEHQYGEPFKLGEAWVSLHSAGHVLGSAQVRIEVGGQVWVVSGDYKRQADPTCEPFEVLACDTFITECTFGLPIYRWPDTHEVARDIAAWREHCAQRGEAAIVYCYALGKAQRVLAHLLPFLDEPVYLHGAIASGVQVYRQAGISLPETVLVSEMDEPGRKADFAGKLVMAPPSASGSTWLRRFGKAQHAFASGWMLLRGNRRRRNMDRGFVVSDHADWPDLLRTIQQTGAGRVIATHGDTRALVKTLIEQGIQAETLMTQYGEDD